MFTCRVRSAADHNGGRCSCHDLEYKNVCACLRWGKLHDDISLREIAAVSSIVPIYRNILIISPRMCVEVPRIDWAEEGTGAGSGTERKPEYWLERRKQSCPLLAVIVYVMRGSLPGTFLLTDANAAAQQRPLLRLHKRVIYSSCDARFHLDCVNRCVSLRSRNLRTRAPIIIIIIILFPNC